MYFKTQIENLLRLAQEQESYEPYYEVLQYIETDGTQYYKTGEILSSTSKVECRASVLGAATPSGSAYIFGAYGSSKNFGINKASSTGSFCVWGSNSTAFTPTLDLDTFYDISLSSDGLYVDGSKVTTPSGTFTGANEAYISWANGTSQPVAKIKLSCLKIYQSGTLAKDYIPVLDNRMQPCLYDKISKTFLYHTNSEGSTSPSFKRWNKYDVDYISFTGTQYIDLGLTASYTSLDKAPVCEFEGKIDTLPSSATTMQRFVSAGVSETNGKYYQIFINWKASGTPKIPIGFQCGTATPYMEATEADTNWHYYKYDISNKEAFIDDISYDMTSYTSDSISIPYNIYIGARNLSGVADRFLVGSLKYLKWSVGGQLVRDFKPSVRTYNDGTGVVTKAFMYDEVYNKAYDNAGTGSFKAYITNSTFSQLRSYVENNTHGYYISATGVVTAQSESDYSGAIPVKQGDVITLTTSTDSRVANKRIHGYNGTSTNNWVQQLGNIAYTEAGGDTRTLSVVVPSGVTYIRISHSIYGETQCDLTITRTYEVGRSVSATPSSSAMGVSNCFDTGLYGTQDTTVKYIAIAYDSTSSSGQLFGSYDGTTSTSQNLTINSTGTGNTAPIRFDGQVITTPIKIPINGFASIVNCRYGLWNNDNLHGTWGNVNDFTTLTTMLILKCNNSVNTRNNGCCYCLILEKDVPVAEFIPVRNASNTSIYGLYDKVSKTLNTGTGTINFNILD